MLLLVLLLPFCLFLRLSEYLAFAAAAGYSAIHQDSKGKQVQQRSWHSSACSCSSSCSCNRNCCMPMLCKKTLRTLQQLICVG